jgi:hypothetical protein
MNQVCFKRRYNQSQHNCKATGFWVTNQRKQFSLDNARTFVCISKIRASKLVDTSRIKFK